MPVPKPAAAAKPHQQPAAPVAQDVNEWQKQRFLTENSNLYTSGVTVATAPQGAMTYTTANLGGLHR